MIVPEFVATVIIMKKDYTTRFRDDNYRFHCSFGVYKVSVSHI